MERDSMQRLREGGIQDVPVQFRRQSFKVQRAAVFVNVLGSTFFNKVTLAPARSFQNHADKSSARQQPGIKPRKTDEGNETAETLFGGDMPVSSGTLMLT